MPFTFTDGKGRVWDVSLDLAAARRIDNSDFSALYSEKFSFVNPDKDLLQALYAKPSLLFAVIWAVIQPQVPKTMGAWFASLGPDGPLGTTGLSDWGTPTFPKEIYDAAELEFATGINGKAKREGRDAFMEAIADFFPELETVLSTLNNQWKRLQNRVDQDLKEMIPEIEATLDKVRAKEVQNFKKELQTLEGNPGEN